MIRETLTPTIIAEASHLHGDFIFKTAGIVRGIVEGHLHNESHETLRISREAWVRGTITSLGPVVIEGKVEGDINSQQRIELSPHANVNGLLNAPNLIIHPGASVDGDFKMTQSSILPQLSLAA